MLGREIWVKYLGDKGLKFSRKLARVRKTPTDLIEKVSILDAGCSTLDSGSSLKKGVKEKGTGGGDFV
ncbi:MAG: hypothetical protein JSV99_09215 [Planctomycetota bacterium]|nr:MAG: hypothetical protein JSV99_09215 [Planctomycetota bacterium]